MLNLDFTDFDLKIDPLLTSRVMDGYGYSNGFLKRRQAIRTQQVPLHFNELELKSFNQGLGRSLWYISLGETEKLVRLLSLFPEVRRHDIWRGIGNAVAYVGGIENSKLQQLVLVAAQYLPSFKCGVSILIKSRTKAATLSNDTESIADFLFNLNCETINNRLIKLESETISTPEKFYFDWVKRVEQDLCS